MTELPDKYQALLVVSFGGPEGRPDVMPFLQNVLRGKNVPERRMAEVAEHYYHFDGVSPINEQNRKLITALEREFRNHDVPLPIYLGNRNWRPFLEETLRQMKADRVKSALAFFPSAFSCYSGCRQYREDVFFAQQRIGEGAPQVHKLRMFFNHPLFIAAAADRLRDAIKKIPVPQHVTRVLFTAHSIPQAMADRCDYQLQLTEASRLVALQAKVEDWKLAYQSRSGPPDQPWLEPDLLACLDEFSTTDSGNVIIMPIGFLSDHMEVKFDLDVEAKGFCDERGINMVRAKTVGTHPKFVTMIRELITERVEGIERRTIGRLPPSHDICPATCCLSGRPGSTSPV
jgi:ferrochelatase